jgi:hypothetical protein
MKTHVFELNHGVGHGRILDLPLHEKNGVYTVDYEGIETRVIEINNSAINKANNIIKYCESEYWKLLDQLTKSLIKNREGVPSAFGFEIAFSMDYIIKSNGCLYVEDLAPRNTKSFSVQRSNGFSIHAICDNNDCHYHPSLQDNLDSIINSSFLSEPDARIYQENVDGAILSYDELGQLNIHFYHIQRINDKIIAIAPQSIIRSVKDYNYDGIRVIADELDDIKQPKCTLEVKDHKFFFYVDFS